MDVVYVIGTGSQWQDNELRYSLRSIERYAIGLGDVYIVGDKLPHFINPERVHYLQYSDVAGDPPALNVYRKIAHVFSMGYFDKFLLSSDDHFFIKPTDFEHYPIFYKGERMPRQGEKGVGGKVYTHTMIDTGIYLEVHDFDTRYFEGHTNKLYTASAWGYLMACGLAKWMFHTEFGISTNAPMAAAILRLHPDYPCHYRKDIKLRHLNTPEDWELLKDANSFSTYDSAIKSGVADYLQQLFPDPCRFEK